MKVKKGLPNILNSKEIKNKGKVLLRARALIEGTNYTIRDKLITPFIKKMFTSQHETNFGKFYESFIALGSLIALFGNSKRENNKVNYEMVNGNFNKEVEKIRERIKEIGYNKVVSIYAKNHGVFVYFDKEKGNINIFPEEFKKDMEYVTIYYPRIDKEIIYGGEKSKNKVLGFYVATSSVEKDIIFLTPLIKERDKTETTMRAFLTLTHEFIHYLATSFIRIAGNGRICRYENEKLAISSSMHIMLKKRR